MIEYVSRAFTTSSIPLTPLQSLTVFVVLGIPCVALLFALHYYLERK